MLNSCSILDFLSVGVRFFDVPSVNTVDPCLNTVCFLIDDLYIFCSICVGFGLGFLQVSMKEF